MSRAILRANGALLTGLLTNQTIAYRVILCERPLMKLLKDDAGAVQNRSITMFQSFCNILDPPFAQMGKRHPS